MGRVDEIIADVEKGNRKAAEKFIQDMWLKDPFAGMEFCFWLFKSGLSETFLGMRRSQKRAVDSCIEDVRKITAKLNPDQLLIVARAHLDFSQGKTQKEHFSNLFLGSRKGEIQRSVELFSLFARARVSLFGAPAEEWGSGEVALGLMFAPLFGEVSKGRLVTNTWTNFLEAVASGDQKACEILEILHTLYATRRGSEWTRLSEWKPPSDAAGLALSMLGGLETAQVPVPDELYDSITAKVRGFEERGAQANEQVYNLLEWFFTERENLGAQQRAMWWEIETAAEYGLRSGGRDTVKLQIQSMQQRTFLYELLQLFPDEFPRVKAKYWISMLGYPVSLTFTLDPNNPTIAQEEATLDLREEGQRVMDLLLDHIALCCYWRIVTGKDTTNLPQRTSVQSVSRRTRGERISHGVRPFFRLLPPGFQPSQEALQRARETLQRLPPPGRTFVREHKRGYREVTGTEPLFSIHEADLGYET